MCYHPICLICIQKSSLEQLIPNKGIKIAGTTINNLRTLMILAETEEDLQEKLNEVNRIGNTFDMKMQRRLILC